MADKRRRSRVGAKAAYKVRQDQRSDPKPKSELARKLTRLTPPKDIDGRKSIVALPPERALYAYDEQKAMGFADTPEIAPCFFECASGHAALICDSSL
jgi:hypothetical protein